MLIQLPCIVKRKKRIVFIVVINGIHQKNVREKIGYPPWYWKSKQQSQSRQYEDARSFKSNLGISITIKTVANVEGSHVVLTKEQFEQFMKFMPTVDTGTGDEIDHECIVGTACYSCSSSHLNTWIIDTNASDHMTPAFNNLIKPIKLTTIEFVEWSNKCGISHSQSQIKK